MDGTGGMWALDSNMYINSTYYTFAISFMHIQISFTNDAPYRFLKIAVARKIQGKENFRDTRRNIETLDIFKWPFKMRDVALNVVWNANIRCSA